MCQPRPSHYSSTKKKRFVKTITKYELDKILNTHSHGSKRQQLHVCACVFQYFLPSKLTHCYLKTSITNKRSRETNENQVVEAWTAVDPNEMAKASEITLDNDVFMECKWPINLVQRKFIQRKDKRWLFNWLLQPARTRNKESHSFEFRRWICTWFLKRPNTWPTSKQDWNNNKNFNCCLLSSVADQSWPTHTRLLAKMHLIRQFECKRAGGVQCRGETITEKKTKVIRMENRTNLFTAHKFATPDTNEWMTLAKI